MVNDTKPTIPTLLAEWGQMSEDERNAAVARAVFGHRVEFLPEAREYETVLSGVVRHRRGGGMSRKYDRIPTIRRARWAIVPDGCEGMSLWDKQNASRPLPAYTSEDSPRSLSKGVKAKVIERVGFQAYLDAIWEVLELSDSGLTTLEVLEKLDAATAEQEMCACWLAVKMEGME